MSRGFGEVFRPSRRRREKARPYLAWVPRKRRDRDWENHYAESKAAIIAAAESICKEHQIPYDRLQFVCFGGDSADYDGLVYVWVEKGARVLNVNLAAEMPETGVTDPGEDGESEPDATATK